MPVDETKLHELAEKATPGPWFVLPGDDAHYRCMTAIANRQTRENNVGPFDESEMLIAVTHHQGYPCVDPDGTNDDANSAFIAAANPAVVLELLGEIAQLRRQIYSTQIVANGTPGGVTMTGDIARHTSAQVHTYEGHDPLHPNNFETTEISRTDRWSVAFRAVHVRHIPTGLTVESHSERSQFRNRDVCMDMLVPQVRAYYRELESRRANHTATTRYMQSVMQAMVDPNEPVPPPQIIEQQPARITPDPTEPPQQWSFAPHRHPRN